MKKVLIIIALLVGIVAGYFSFGILFMEFTPTAILTYSLPDFPDLPDTPLPLPHSAVAIDGALVASHADEQPFPTASTAKIILALAVSRQYDSDPNSTITISQADYDKYLREARTGGSHTKVRVGQQITLYDALASVLLRSSNNMADTLADHLFGSHTAYKAFAADMLRDLGATHTTIGDDASGRHYSTTSTAGDLAIIGYYLLQDETLAQIVSTKSIDIPVHGKVDNTNRLLGTDGIIGIKTGQTDEAGYCLVLGAKHDGYTVTTAILGAKTRNQPFEISHELINRYNLDIVHTIPTGTEIGYFDTWWAGQVPIVTSEDAQVRAWGHDNIELTLVAPAPTDTAPSEALRVTINGTPLDIPAGPTKIPEPTLWQKVLRLAGL